MKIVAVCIKHNTSLLIRNYLLKILRITYIYRSISNTCDFFIVSKNYVEHIRQHPVFVTVMKNLSPVNQCIAYRHLHCIENVYSVSEQSNKLNQKSSLIL